MVVQQSRKSLQVLRSRVNVPEQESSVVSESVSVPESEKFVVPVSSGSVEFVSEFDGARKREVKGSYEPVSVSKSDGLTIIEKRDLLYDGSSSRYTKRSVYVKERTVVDEQGNVVSREVYDTYTTPKGRERAFLSVRETPERIEEKVRNNEGSMVRRVVTDKVAGVSRNIKYGEVMSSKERVDLLRKSGLSDSDINKLTPGQQKAVLDPVNARRYTGTPVPSEIMSKASPRVGSVVDASGNVFVRGVVGAAEVPGQFIGVRSVVPKDVPRGVPRGFPDAESGVYASQKGEQLLVLPRGVKKPKSAGELVRALEGERFEPVLSYVPVRPKEEFRLSTNKFGFSKGGVVDVTGLNVLSVAGSGVKEKKSFFRESVLARPVRSVGNVLSGSVVGYFEDEPQVFGSVRRSELGVGSVPFDVLGNVVFGTGVSMREEPDRFLGRAILVGGGARVAGSVAGGVVSFVGRQSPVFAKGLESSFNTLMGVEGVRQVVARPDSINIPELVAGGVGFAKGYRVSNPVPVVRFGEAKLKNDGSIYDTKEGVLLGQFGSGETPTRVIQFGKVFRSKSDTSVFVQGSNQATSGSLKSSVLLKNDVLMPGDTKVTSFLRGGNIVGGDVNGMSFQLLAVEGSKPKVLVFDKPFFESGSGGLNSEGLPSSIGSVAQKFKIYGVNEITGRVYSVKEGVSRFDSMELGNKLVASKGNNPVEGVVFWEVPGRQQEFSAFVAVDKPLNIKMSGKKIRVSTKFEDVINPHVFLDEMRVKPYVDELVNRDLGSVEVVLPRVNVPSRGFFGKVLEFGRSENVLGELPKNDVVFGDEILAGRGLNLGRRGSVRVGFGGGESVFEPVSVPKGVGSGVVRDSLFVGYVPRGGVVGRGGLVNGFGVGSVFGVLGSGVNNGVGVGLSPVVLPRSLPRSVPRSVPRSIPNVIPSLSPVVLPRSLPRSVPRSVPRSIPRIVPRLVPEVVPRITPEIIPRSVPRGVPELVPTIPPKLLKGGGGRGEDVLGGGVVDAFDVLVRRKKRLFRLAGGVSRGVGLRLGSEYAKSTLGVTFMLRRRGVTVDSGGVGGVDLSGFRTYKVVGGRRVPLVDTFIQRRGLRLGSVGERREILLARRRVL